MRERYSMSVREGRAVSGHATHGDIAIIGLACTYPGARDTVRFWQNIVNKFSAIAEVNPERWDPAIFYDPDPAKEDKLYSKVGGYLPSSITFNPLKAGVPPSAIPGSEPDHYLMLRAMYEAMEDAGYLNKTFDRDRVSVILGRGNYLGPAAAWINYRMVGAEMVMRIVASVRPDLTPEELGRIRESIQRQMPKLNSENAAGLIPNIGTGRVANRMDFMGANYTIDAACASSLLATENALHNLLTGKDDMVLTGGSHVFAHISFLAVFDKTRAVSASSVIRPFDATADGTMSGEGIGILVLKRLADAERDGDRIYAVMKGAGSASDGRAKGVMAPRVEGEELAIRRALAMAKVGPETVELVEGHGTATGVGDTTEIEALQRVYGDRRDGWPMVALGSVKSNIGHAMPAAGAAGMIKATLALYHKILPPTLNIVEPHPLLARPESRFYLNTEARPWIHRNDGAPRRAAVDAFGFGGINAHVVMEEYRTAAEDRQPTLLREWEQELFLFEGATRAELVARMEHVRSYVETVEGVSAADLAYTLNTSLEGKAERVAIVAGTFAELVQRMDRVRGKLADPACVQIRERQGVYYFANAELHNGKVAFLFPGEGAQYVNMLAELCMHFPEVRGSFDAADTARKSGAPLSSVVFPLPALTAEAEAAAEAELFSIERATETVLTADGAMFRLMERLGLRADMMSGHSAGEWIAMAASGMVDIDVFIASMERLEGIYREVSANTEIPRMAMLAVGAGKERVAELAAQTGVPFDLANDNCPHQTVIVVEPASADRVVEHFLTSGVFIEKLPYDRGYHTPAFSYIGEPLRRFFTTLGLRGPAVPVYSCTTAEPIPADETGILDVVADTFARPLIFQDTIRRMYDDGARIFVEVGPRGNLTAFVDDILRGQTHLAVPMDQFRRPGLLGLCHGLGLLAAAHVPLQLDGLYARRNARKLSLDAKQDTVLPEERQPGSVQVSLCYAELVEPAAGLVPPLQAKAEPAPEPVVTAKPEPVAERQPEAAAPAAPAVAEVAEVAAYVYEPQAAAYAAVPAEASALLMQDHFALMDQFLQTQEMVMAGFLTQNGGMAAVAEPEWMPEAVIEARQPGPMLAGSTILEQTPGETVTLEIPLDLQEHKYLDDHCLYFASSDTGRQGPKMLAMPLTGSLELMAEAALLLAPGERVVAIGEAQALRPVSVVHGEATPRCRLEMRRTGAKVRGTLYSEAGERLTEAVITVAAEYTPAPEPEPLVLEEARDAQCRFETMYTAHRMFHGPRFQGIHDVEKVGSNGLLARLKVLANTDCFGSTATPEFVLDPFLFDAAGQLVGYWPFEYLPEGFFLLPIRLGEVSIHGPSPAPGTDVECRLRIRSVTYRQLIADFDLLLPDGTVFARTTGWMDWRFYLGPGYVDFYRFSNVYYNGKPMESAALRERGICCHLLEAPGDAAKAGLSESLWARLVLDADELDEHLQIPDEQTRIGKLSRRALAKDATRGWLAAQNRPRTYPVDIMAFELPGGAFEMRGPWRKDGDVLYAAVDNTGARAAGVAGPTRLAVVVREVKNGEEPAAEAFAPEEREWLQRLSNPSEWTARATAAKQAVARWLRPDSADGDFWTTLLIPHLHEGSGVLHVADPGSAVNAEDVVTVITLRDGDLVIAVATS
jgi:acyl transferase domain-containing protein